MDNTEMIMCPVCGKYYRKKGVKTHYWRMHGDGVNFDPNIGYKNGTVSPWNKGLTKQTSESVKRGASKLRRKKSELELELDDDGKLKQRWINKRVNARKEGIECKLTFEEYCLLVKEAGIKSSQLGFTGMKYVLARYNDTGNYEMGNCRFITQLENSREKNARLFGKNNPVVG